MKSPRTVTASARSWVGPVGGGVNKLLHNMSNGDKVEENPLTQIRRLCSESVSFC